jgi:hypothetical protein
VNPELAEMWREGVVVYYKILPLTNCECTKTYQRGQIVVVLIRNRNIPNNMQGSFAKTKCLFSTKYYVVVSVIREVLVSGLS